MSFLTDHTAPGLTRAEWRGRSAGGPAPFTDWTNYVIDAEHAADLVRKAGSDAPVVDLESYPGDDKVDAFEQAVGLIRTAYGDSRRLRRNRKPILYYGLWPEAGLWPLCALHERQGIARDRRGIGRQIRRMLHVAELANTVSIGLYISNGPDRAVNGELIPSIMWEIERTIAVAEMWEVLAPDIPRYVWVMDRYIFANPGQSQQELTPADKAMLGAFIRDSVGAGLLAGCVYWTEREPDAGMLAALSE